jgi:hypothetical protein
MKFPLGSTHSYEKLWVDAVITARHCLQALWKIGLAGKEQQEIGVIVLATG